jgi:hypothetical protein
MLLGATGARSNRVDVDSILVRKKCGLTSSQVFRN